MKKHKLHKQSGFTLIEMIGVLAIIAILVGAVAPRIFEAIEDSKVSSTSSLVKALQLASGKYYADMGNLMPLNSANNNSNIIVNGYDGNNYTNANSLAQVLTHTRAAAQTGGDWPKFRGPYLNDFTGDAPPIGDQMQLRTRNTISNGAAPAANVHTNYDLDGDNVNDIPDGSPIVTLYITQVGQGEWEKLDGIFDSGVQIGLTVAQRQARGKVKYDAAVRTLRVYIASK